MGIRLATLLDSERIRYLIAELGFDHPLSFIELKLQQLLQSRNDIIIVYEINGNVVGLITLHFSTQLAFSGDIMSIGYMVIDEEYRGQSIGRKLEEKASEIARERECSLIEVFSQAKRTDAHRFYKRQGYQVTEKFFSKEVKL